MNHVIYEGLLASNQLNHTVGHGWSWSWSWRVHQLTIIFGLPLHRNKNCLVLQWTCSATNHVANQPTCNITSVQTGPYGKKNITSIMHMKTCDTCHNMLWCFESFRDNSTLPNHTLRTVAHLTTVNNQKNVEVDIENNTAYLRPPKSFFFSLNSKICLFAIRRGKQPAGEIPNSGETFRRQENGTAFCIFPFCWEKKTQAKLGVIQA